MMLSPRLAEIIDGLRAKELTIAFGESCTGGRLAADLTTIPGSSHVVVGSAVCYQIAAKHRILGLDFVTPKNVVSAETVVAMAKAARGLFDADIGVATTGYLDGPARAYWCIHSPRVPQTDSQASETTYDLIKFPVASPRDMNREILVREVMKHLAIWLTFQ